MGLSLPVQRHCHQCKFCIGLLSRVWRECQWSRNANTPFLPGRDLNYHSDRTCMHNHWLPVKSRVRDFHVGPRHRLQALHDLVQSSVTKTRLPDTSSTLTMFPLRCARARAHIGRETSAHNITWKIRGNIARHQLKAQLIVDTCVEELRLKSVAISPLRQGKFSCVFKKKATIVA